MKSGNRAIALTSLGASVLLVLGAFLAVWLVPRGASPAAAQDTGNTDKPSHITVRGSGTISAKPNSLVMNVGVSIQDTTVKAAQDKVAEAMTKVVDRLKAAGITEESYRTLQYTVETVMDFDSKGAPQKVTGFRVMNMIEITFRDSARAAEVLDQLVAAGVNTIYSGGYTFSNLAELQKQAYEAAVKDAQDRATRLATLSGLELGKIVSVTEAGANVPGVIYDKAQAGGGGSGPYFPGQSNVGIDVIVVYEAK